MFRSSRWFVRELARREAAWAAERQQLLDRIMLLSGRPWNLAPADFVTVEDDDKDVPVEHGSALEWLPEETLSA